jgi:hypothetical protein
MADAVGKLASLEGHLIGSVLARGTEKKGCFLGKNVFPMNHILLLLPDHTTWLFSFLSSIKKERKKQKITCNISIRRTR